VVNLAENAEPPNAERRISVFVSFASSVNPSHFASAYVRSKPILSLKVVHQMNSIQTIAMEKPQRRRFRKSIPLKPACPGCRMVKNDWPGEGYTHEGETYCCQGCAEGTGCVCVAVGKPGFSRQGQKVTRADPRPGEQRSGAPEPKGELSGQRDSLGTEEALDQGG
jgi:hypothetical protein